jgi:hypothetical protein
MQRVSSDVAVREFLPETMRRDRLTLDQASAVGIKVLLSSESV